MFQQKFLTALNTISTGHLRPPFPQNRSNLITDFINATYQGSLNEKSQPSGRGTIIDDQFNFITCENWVNGKINGWTFVKLGNQVGIWGEWENNGPKDNCVTKVGPYTIYIPYKNTNPMIHRPRKCLVYNQGKEKLYVATIERFPEGTKSKRQYSVVVEQKYFIKEKTIAEAAQQIDLKISQSKSNMINFLNFMSSQLKTLNVTEKQNGLFIMTNFENHEIQPTTNLGLLLDHKKMTTKSVGMFRHCKKDNILRKGCDSQIEGICLNGIGLSKTIQKQQIIGIFKDDMIIKQLKSKDKIDRLKNTTKNYINNEISGKQYLAHQHMKSLSFQNKYIYFPEIKQIVGLTVQIHKYVQMIEKLSQSQQIQIDESMHHFTTKYQNPQHLLKRNSSGSSIIDQFSQFKLDLKKDIYHLSGHKHKQQVHENQVTPKKPGFIRTKSPCLAMGKTPSRSPSNSILPKGSNKKMDTRTPNRLEEKCKI